jgi:hypothetical protein
MEKVTAVERNKRKDIKVCTDTKLYLDDLKKDMKAPSIDDVIKSVLGINKNKKPY